MAQVYKFKVKLVMLEDDIWRDIEMTSLSSVAKLGYAILAAFGAEANHLFYISIGGKRYEFAGEDDDFVSEEIFDPLATKLEALKLSIGDSFVMGYDYGADWKFGIEIISVSEMPKGSGTHYPYITDGAGKGILEDTSPYALVEFKELTDQTGALPTYYDFESDEEKGWDYRKFDLDNLNGFYKMKILYIKEAYEGE